MRRIVFVILGVLVLGTVGFFAWREFRVPAINYVTDGTFLAHENHFVVRRLYAVEIDHEAYEKELERIMFVTDYDEDMRFQAALRAGSPAFLPAFNFVVSSTIYDGEDEIWIDGYIVVERAENQTERRFRMGSTSVEAVAQGDLVIERLELYGPPGAGADPLPQIYTDTQAAVDITGQTAFRIAMSGSGGMITLQFVYNVDVETPLILTVQEERLLRLNIVVSTNEFGTVSTDFVLDPYDNLEQLLEDAQDVPAAEEEEA
jgi:hypothetical protein